jgi:hypothetical protein
VADHTTVHSKFGIWKSTDGGINWTLLKEAKAESNGATDLEIDSQTRTSSTHVLGRRHLQVHQRR